MSKTIDEALVLITRDYPQLEVNVARDGGDVVEFLLCDNEDFGMSNCVVASYNMWYPGGINYYELKQIN